MDLLDKGEGGQLEEKLEEGGKEERKKRDKGRRSNKKKYYVYEYSDLLSIYKIKIKDLSKVNL